MPLSNYNTQIYEYTYYSYLHTYMQTFGGKMKVAFLLNQRTVKQQFSSISGEQKKPELYFVAIHVVLSSHIKYYFL